MSDAGTIDVARLLRALTFAVHKHRDQRRIEHAAASSAAAKQLKIADKICNVRDIAANPPKDWPTGRKREYLRWSEQVVHGCRGINTGLDTAFDQALSEAQRVFSGG